jgi:hypothetical protein
MATTTNYSWTTPDDTALVKDGAAAIRSLGTAIDTTVFTNAGAAINKTIVDAKGDIIAATAADTVSRLAVGSNNQVLTADSSTATGLKWAVAPSGGMTLLSTTTLSGAATTITGISQDYTDLRLVFSGVTNNTANSGFRLHFNSALTSVVQRARIDGATSMALSTATYQLITPADASYEYLRTSADNINIVEIPLYSDSSINHVYTSYSYYKRVGDIHYTQHIFGGVYGAAAISSVEIVNTGGTWAGGTCRIYGIK